MPDFARASTPDAVIPATLHPSGFDQSDSNFYSMSLISDGCVYYTLSTHDKDTHGRCYRYDPSADELVQVFDLGEATGETGAKMLPQGKSHSPFHEVDGKLYLATHYGFFATKEGKEMVAELPPGYKPYPGGHILEYDMKTGAVKDLAKGPEEEGFITFNVDPERRTMYCLTWPAGIFMAYDMDSGELRDLGRPCRGGEKGDGDQYFCLCRAFAIDPRDGMVYFTNPDGEVLRYEPGADQAETFEGVHMKRDIFGCWDPHKPGHQGYNWRDVLWHEPTQTFFGVHPKSGWLVQFDPKAPRLELVERIAADPLRRDGSFEPFRYGYLTLKFGPDGRTVYYLTSDNGLTAEDGRKVNTTTHLVTYNIDTRQYIDQGVLRLPDGRYPTRSQTLVIHPDSGRLFAAPWIEKPGREEGERVKEQCDLISFPDPLATV